MSTYEKTLKSWETKTEEKWTTVEAVLESEGFTLANVVGSHFQYRHPKLLEMVKMFPGTYISKDYGPAGQIIVIRRGSKAYSETLNRILEAIKRIKEFDELKSKRG